MGSGFGPGFGGAWRADCGPDRAARSKRLREKPLGFVPAHWRGIDAPVPHLAGIERTSALPSPATVSSPLDPPLPGTPLSIESPWAERPLSRAADWAHTVRGRRSCRGNISEPRAPVRLRCAVFLWSDPGKARVRRGLTARGFSLSRPLLKTAAKKKQQGTIPARKRSPLKTLSRAILRIFSSERPYIKI